MDASDHQYTWMQGHLCAASIDYSKNIPFLQSISLCLFRSLSVEEEEDPDPSSAATLWMLKFMDKYQAPAWIFRAGERQTENRLRNAKPQKLSNLMRSNGWDFGMAWHRGRVRPFIRGEARRMSGIRHEWAGAGQYVFSLKATAERSNCTSGKLAGIVGWRAAFVLRGGQLSVRW